MKMYVITIMDNERSVQVADRCIQSGLVFGNKIECLLLGINDVFNIILGEGLKQLTTFSAISFRE